MVGFRSYFVFFIASFGMALTAFARPPFDPSQVPRAALYPLEEKFHPLAAAKIVVLDPALFRQDFTDVGYLARLQDFKIGPLLLRSGAAISIPQARQTVTNSPIPIVEHRFVQGLRPAAYGRAALFPLLLPMDGTAVYIDCKGCGGLNPRNRDHSNGLLTLGEALREFVLSKVVSLILEAEGYEPGVVPIYGIADAGFDVTYVEEGKAQVGEGEPAGLLFRRAAHRSRPDGYTDPARSQRVEAILRKFGLTSDWSISLREFQLLTDNNLQTSREGAVFDFGAFLPVARFSHSPVQADPEFRLPAEKWAAAAGDSAWMDQLRAWCSKVAREWRAGTLTQNQIERTIEREWVGPVRAMLRKKKCQDDLVNGGRRDRR